ncbi:TetR/AcrR family transcriptional regulator [Phenylobacterium sp.]|uniref:TetR/AcrR family transcriptional regulator n=1 Tax=Phenylobacterium sp. TaxID=1871053 RepID=UPI0025FD18F0|nr:TetR/AcrR family transcriptional regulator [Phenylobacterium sp.]
MDMPLDRRAELLAQIVTALLDNGAGDLSLRPLAERVGTSARLLIYHFGSKEQLIASALAEVRGQVAASLSARAAREAPESQRGLLTMFWDWATETPNQRYFRLLFEIDGLAMYDRISFSEEVRRANSAAWTTLIDRAAGRLPQTGEQSAARSTLIVCAISGLLQEFLSSGDRQTTTAALSALIALVAPDAPASPHVPGSSR